MDQTKFIKRSISEVEETLLIALSLVILIIYLFFRDWIIALRPLLDIPVSLIGAFFIMYIFGFTINVFRHYFYLYHTGNCILTHRIFGRICRQIIPGVWNSRSRCSSHFCLCFPDTYSGTKREAYTKKCGPHLVLP